MDIVLLVFRLLLAAVFAVAAVGKLADRSSARRAVINFGVPEALASPLAWLLPAAELMVALLLIPVESARVGAAAALALLLVFIAGIAVNLARGNKPDCHCFGQIHSAPIGWSVIARNLLLAAVASFVFWQGKDGAGVNVLFWLRELSKGQIALLAVGVTVAVLLSAIAVMLARVIQQQKQMLERLDDLEMALDGGELPAAVRREEFAFDAKGLPVGAPAPEFSLKNLDGQEISLEALLSQKKKPVLLLFVSPSCGPCVSLLPLIVRWQRDYAEAFTLALVSRSSVEDNRKEFDGHELKYVLLQAESEVADEYQAKWTPCAVLISADGAIASQLALGVDAIKTLVQHAASANAARPWVVAKDNHNGHEHAPDAYASLEIGAHAPPVKLSDLEGATFDLTQFRGDKTLLLFWNPDCTFCQQMLEDLKELETRPPERAPKLLVISKGTVEANRAMGLLSPVLLDQDFGIAKSYGAHGTPSAVLIDAQGRIASVVAAGAPDVLALAGAKSRQAQKEIL